MLWQSIRLAISTLDKVHPAVADDGPGVERRCELRIGRLARAVGGGAGAGGARCYSRAERDTFPDHLPRERVVIDPPTTCECCGGNRLRKLSEDVTRTLETTPRRWKVIETVREKFSCRDCETISQAPAPFHVIPRAWAGPSLLAMIVFEKFG